MEAMAFAILPRRGQMDATLLVIRGFHCRAFWLLWLRGRSEKGNEYGQYSTFFVGGLAIFLSNFLVETDRLGSLHQPPGSPGQPPKVFAGDEYWL
jgi:hypothetical protein